MNRHVITGALAGITLLGGVSAAHAQFFNYVSTFTPNPIPSSTFGSQINVINNSNLTGLDASGMGTQIILANFTSTSTAPDRPGAQIDSPFTIALNLTKASPTGIQPLADTGVTKTFTGIMTGHLGANSALIAPTYTSPTVQTFDLGDGGLYTVALNGFVSPGGPGANLLGGLGANVTYSRNVGPTGTPDTPEPGAVAMLIGLGSSGLLVARRRRSRA